MSVDGWWDGSRAARETQELDRPFNAPAHRGPTNDLWPKPPDPSQKAPYNKPTPQLTPVALMGLIFWLAGLCRC